MVTVHAFLAILAGFATMTALSLLLAGVLKKFAPVWSADAGELSPGAASVNLAYGFVAAIAGGYITAWLGELKPLSDVLALAIVVLVVEAVSVLQARDRQPVWYLTALLVLSALGVFVGGLTRLQLWGML